LGSRRASSGALRWRAGVIVFPRPRPKVSTHDENDNFIAMRTNLVRKGGRGKKKSEPDTSVGPVSRKHDRSKESRRAVAPSGTISEIDDLIVMIRLWGWRFGTERYETSPWAEGWKAAETAFLIVLQAEAVHSKRVRQIYRTLLEPMKATV
jgi:hypothetical protein